MSARFAADGNLGTLVKWLRILGYDSTYEPKTADAEFLRRAAEAQRIVLTRKGDLARLSCEGPLVVVKSDRVEYQLQEVLGALFLQPDPEKKMTRCLRCNTPLEAIPKERAEGSVPSYIYWKCSRFKGCPCCGGIYWPGTHRRQIEARIRALIPRQRL